MSGALATMPAQAAPIGTVTGVVWHDVNGNGLRESGEPGLAGALVQIE